MSRIEACFGSVVRVAVFCVVLILPGCSGLQKTVADIYRGPYSEYSSSSVPHSLLVKPVKTGRLSSTYGWRISPSGLRKPKRHLGVDYSAPAGTPVIAAGDGVVIERRFSQSYGNVMVIEHENGFSTVYAHLMKFEKRAKKGRKIRQGQVIGFVGSTGRSTGPHLHYELRFRGKKVDPLYAQR